MIRLKNEVFYNDKTSNEEKSYLTRAAFDPIAKSKLLSYLRIKELAGLTNLFNT